MTTHALYRFYDNTDELLYVGITLDPGKRFKQHSTQKAWWSDVADITLQKFDSRIEVLAAEREAIKTESPRYNVIHNQASWRCCVCNQLLPEPIEDEDPWDENSHCQSCDEHLFRFYDEGLRVGYSTGADAGWRNALEFVRKHPHPRHWDDA